MDSLELSRFDAVAHKSGHYESYYLKAGDPHAPRAVWIRYTVHKRPGEQPRASLWATLFDRAAGRPRAVKQTAAPGDLSGGEDRYLAVGELGEFTPRLARGQIAAEGRRAAWDLNVCGGEPRLEHLPSRLYDAPLPRTKLLTLRPAAVFDGWVEFDGERVDLSAWPGMIGHNWGARHAEQWVWLHGAGFDGRGGDTWLDVAIGRVKAGPWTTPWIANGALSLDGRRLRVGGLGRVRATRVTAGPGRLQFDLPGDGMTVSGHAESPAADTVAWIYADPDGSQHHTLNCSISELSLSVGRAGGGDPTVELHTTHGCAYELGDRDTGHGVPVEPFADG